MKTDLEIEALSTNHRHKERIFRHKLSAIDSSESASKDGNTATSGCMMEALMMINAVCILIPPQSHFNSTIFSPQNDTIDILFEDGLDINRQKELPKGHQNNIKKQLKKRRNIRIKQGAKICTYTSRSESLGEQSIEMLSPLSGRLLEINPRLCAMSTSDKMSLKGYVMAILPDNYVLNAVSRFENGDNDDYNDGNQGDDNDGNDDNEKEKEAHAKKKRKT